MPPVTPMMRRSAAILNELCKHQSEILCKWNCKSLCKKPLQLFRLKNVKWEFVRAAAWPSLPATGKNTADRKERTHAEVKSKRPPVYRAR